MKESEVTDEWEVTVSKLPKCNFCEEPAHYDFRTNRRVWAYGCERHYKMHRASILTGVGLGQRLVVEEPLAVFFSELMKRKGGDLR